MKNRYFLTVEPGHIMSMVTMIKENNYIATMWPEYEYTDIANNQIRSSVFLISLDEEELVMLLLKIPFSYRKQIPI